MKLVLAILSLTFLDLTCTSAPPLTACFHEGCIFNGDRHKEGNILAFSCFNLTCTKTGWNFDRIDHINCNVCMMLDDPHIYSFDNQLYHWYGLCNYSLSQSPICDLDSSYEPKSAVYADFIHCNQIASCVDCTTYVIDPNTVVTIEHKTLIPDSLYINGNLLSPLPTTPSAVSDCSGNYYPAIVWRDADCAYVVGTTFSIKACYNDLFIYAKKEYLKDLVGLCGFYSGDTSDDYVPRGECFSTAPYADFAISWLTKVHKKDCDIKMEIDLNEKANAIEESCDKDKFYEMCEKQVTEGYGRCRGYQEEEGNSHVEGDIENCVLDCCFDPDFCEEWLKTVYEMARISCETILQENGIFGEAK